MSPNPSPKRARRQYVFASATTSVKAPGDKYPTTIHQGSVWHAGSPMVLANPDLFTDDPPVVHPVGWEPPVEQATAAPREVRDSGRG
jgi:hypothetical protein